MWSFTYIFCNDLVLVIIRYEYVVLMSHIKSSKSSLYNTFIYRVAEELKENEEN